VIELATRPVGTASSPFDALAGSRRLFLPMLWLVAALVVLCVAAPPTLTVVGQVLFHISLNAADLGRDGWPL